MRVLVVAGMLGISLLAAACSGADSSGESSKASTESSTTPFPVSGDGSIITPSGFVFKGDFAICNEAKCAEPDPDGNAECTCQILSNTWTLSPVPTSSFTILEAQGLIMSTFTTTNVVDAQSVKCSGGRYAECFGALCEENADGTATCSCPVTSDFPGEWMKYVRDCSDPSSGCSADLVSAAPLYSVANPSYNDFVAAVNQSSAEVPGIPKPCPGADDDATGALASIGFAGAAQPEGARVCG